MSGEAAPGYCSALSRCFRVLACNARSALVEPRPGWLRCFDDMAVSMMEEYGVQPKLVNLEDGLGVVFVRVRGGDWGSRRIVFFTLATLLTVTLAGFDVAGSYAQVASLVGAVVNVPLLAFLFVVGLLGPLALHESGHFLVSRARRVPVTLPLFIPAPPPRFGGIGTFGAIIRMKGMPLDRESLALVGLSGPLAGFVAGIVVGVVGAELSLRVPLHLFREVAAAGGVSETPFAPLALLLLLSGSGAGGVILHPLAVAVYIVFLVTFLNLLPIGWLDGGHVVYAVFGERVHQATSMLVPWLSLLLALVYPQLLVLAVFSLFAFGLFIFTSRGVHPGVLNPYKPLPAARAALYAALYTAMLVLTMPVPL